MRTAVGFAIGLVTLMSAMPALAQDNTNGNNGSNNNNNQNGQNNNDSACDGDTNPCRNRCSSSSCCNSCRYGRCNGGSCGGSSSCSCRTPSLSLSVTGLRGSFTRVSSATGGTSDSLGVGFAGGVDTYALDGTTHGSLHWVLGGGEAGFEGKLAGELDFGYRIDVTEHTGPFGRAGFDGRMQGNDKLYFSTLELPRLQLGWQYLGGKTLVEAGARGGAVLAGRYNPGDEGVRRLSGIEYGAFATAQVDWLRMEGTAYRIDSRSTGNGRAVDVGRASVCAVAGKVGICGDAMFLRGDADLGPNAGGVQAAMSTYAGVSLGVASW
jgi:hypothetical protein